MNKKSAETSVDTGGTIYTVLYKPNLSREACDEIGKKK